MEPTADVTRIREFQNKIQGNSFGENASGFIAGSFRASLVTELRCPQDLGNMPWHFYDK